MGSTGAMTKTARLRALNAARRGLILLFQVLLGVVVVLGTDLAPAAAQAAEAECASGSGPDLAGRTLTPDTAELAGHGWSFDANGEELRFLRLACADLRGATLQGFELAELTLVGADLTGADLHGVEADRILLDGANLTDANLAGLELGQTRFANTVVAGTNFSRADLSQAVFAGMDLSGLDLSHAELSQADLGDATLRGADLRGATMTQAQLAGADLTEARLDGVDFGQANMAGVDLTGVQAAGAKFTQVAELDEVSLRGADLRRASFSQSRLRGADLRDADLTRADLVQADLTDADLTGTTITGADWTQARSGGIVTGNRLIGQFPVDPLVLVFVLAIAAVALRRHVRSRSGRLPALTVLAVIAAALVYQVIAALPLFGELRLELYLMLVGPMLFASVFLGMFVVVVYEGVGPGWRSALSLLVLLTGISVVMASVFAFLLGPLLDAEPLQQACSAASCLGGFARGITGLLLGLGIGLVGFILLAKAPHGPGERRPRPLRSRIRST